MADRYRLQADEKQTPAAFGRVYDGNGAIIGGALGGLGKGVEGWGLWLQERQDKWDAATVMNAQTEFARRMTDYLDNPETGATVKRKFGAANGLTKDTDKFADKTARDISAMLDNDRQRAVFKSGIDRAKMPYIRQSSSHEARELEAFRKQAFEANIAAAGDMYIRGADNPEIREQAVGMAANAIRSQYFGADEKYIRRAIDETRSGMAAQYVAKAARDDPRAALEMLKDESLGLLPETRDKLEAQIKPRAEIYEIQEIADELAQKYPQGDERELYDYVRRHYEGEKEEKIISAVKARVNERKINEDNEERALREQQSDNYDNYLAAMLRGEYPTHEQLERAVADGTLDARHGWQLSNMLGTMATAAGTRKQLAKTIPGWNGMTESEQDEAVMKAMPDGPTKREHEAEVSRLLKTAFDSGVTDSEFKSDVNNSLGNMRITRREAAEFLGLRGKMGQEQKAFLNGVQKDLKANLNQLFNTGKGKQEAKNAAEMYFHEALRQLDPTSTTYRKDVMTAMKDAMIKGVEASGTKLWDSHLFWENTPTKFNERYGAITKALDEHIKNTKEYEPRFTMDNVNLPETREAPKAKGAGKIAGKTSYEELRDVVDSSAATYGVEPELVRAIIKQESNWKTDIVSPKGAQGLMQLMPKTAKGLGVTDSFDAGQNIRGGTKYISDLLKKYGGDVEKALAAYNAGPGRVPVKGELDLSKLPKETRGYVKNVSALYRRYLKEQEKSKPQAQPQRKDITQTTLTMNGDMGGAVSGDVAPQQRKQTVEECLFGGPGNDFGIGGMF